jgi:hypothetical protein
VNPAISMKEAADILRKAISGELPLVSVAGKGKWQEGYCGNFEFTIGDWTFIFFNDCDELDYVDKVTAPDGRIAEFDDWCTDELIGCPFNDLTDAEMAKLEDMVYVS